MLKEGWDVNNLYTIVPLRAANARILIEQSIGRGLRLPYGVRTGVTAVDRLNIIAHDKFQEIVDEANKLDSAVRLTQVILDPAKDFRNRPRRSLPSQNHRGKIVRRTPRRQRPARSQAKPPSLLFQTEQERKIAEITVKVIQQRTRRCRRANYLQKAEIQACHRQGSHRCSYTPPARTDGIDRHSVVKPDIAAVVAKATKLVIDQTIDIPRIVVVPTGDVTSWFQFVCSGLRVSNRLQPVSREFVDLSICGDGLQAGNFCRIVGGQLVEASARKHYLCARSD